MTITLKVNPELEACLLAQAEARGMALEQYILSIAEEAALQPVPAATRMAREDAVRRMIAFGEKHQLALGEPVTRKLLHDEHRY